MEWKRARSEEQKEQRVSEIVAATARLYEVHDFEAISFLSIAKEANFTRSNLYKYFNSKEEIFLEFLKHDFILWKRDLLQAFRKDKDYSVEEFSAIWVEIQVKNERLLKLISILNIFLEKNVSIQRLKEFKRSMKYELGGFSELIGTLFPTLTNQKIGRFLKFQLALAIGLYQMAKLSPTQQKVLEDPEFKGLRVDFKVLFQDAVQYLLQGLLDPLRV